MDNKNQKKLTGLILGTTGIALAILSWMYIPNGKGTMSGVLRTGLTFGSASLAFSGFKIAGESEQ